MGSLDKMQTLDYPLPRPPFKEFNGDKIDFFCKHSPLRHFY